MSGQFHFLFYIFFLRLHRNGREEGFFLSWVSKRTIAKEQWLPHYIHHKDHTFCTHWVQNKMFRFQLQGGIEGQQICSRNQAWWHLVLAPQVLATCASTYPTSYFLLPWECIQDTCKQLPRIQEGIFHLRCSVLWGSRRAPGRSLWCLGCSGSALQSRIGSYRCWAVDTLQHREIVSSGGRGVALCATFVTERGFHAPFSQRKAQIFSFSTKNVHVFSHEGKEVML